MNLSADDLRPHFLASWGPDTWDPHGDYEWSADNPARDQCGVTALVVQDLLGGDLIMAQVHVDGAQVGHHYWVRLPDGTDVDLTADQFFPQERVVNPRVVVRPPEGPKRMREEYALLKQRVLDSLNAAP